MTPSSHLTQSATDSRNLKLLSFGGLAAAVVGSALTLTLSLGLSIPSASAAELAVGDDAFVSTDAVNVRDDATTGRSILTTLVTGDGMTVLDGSVTADGYEWYQVTAADGTTGWAAGDFLSPPTAPVLAVGGGAVVNTDALHVRDEASLSGTTLTTLITGDAMTVVGDAVTADGYTWYQVTTLDGTTGYVMGEFVGTLVAPALEADDAAVVDPDALNVRDDATVSGVVLVTLANSDTMMVMNGPIVADGFTWYSVEAADGTTGWVVGEYLAAA